MKVEGLPGPTDSWITLAGLARETSTIRLGTLVTSATFRHPGPLAISVAEVPGSAMSGGRVDFGIGAGWFEDEHRAYAIPFPDLGERFDRFEEQLEIILAWARSGKTFDHQDPLHRLGFTDAAQTGSATPSADHHRRRRRRAHPALAARFAAEFNVAFVGLDFLQTQFGRVRAAAEQIGR